MFALIVATVFSSAFGLVVRHAQLCRRNLWAVGAVNYVVASAFHVSRWLAMPEPHPLNTTLYLGILGGVVYSGSFLMLMPLMRARGVSVASSILRLSVIIPVGLSVVLWGEHPGPIQTVGAGVAMLSLPLLAYRPSAKTVNGLAPPRNWGAMALLATLFVGNGLCATVVRAFHQTQVPGQTSLFLGILFGTAALVTTAVWLAHRQGTRLADVAHGSALGACNAIGNLSLVAALGSLSGVIVFPFHSAVGLVIVALFARAVWREPLRRHELLGMGMALSATVLINAA